MDNYRALSSIRRTNFGKKLSTLTWNLISFWFLFFNLVNTWEWVLGKFTDMVNTLNYLLTVKGNFHFRIYGQLNQFLSSITILGSIVCAAGHTESRPVWLYEVYNCSGYIQIHIFLSCMPLDVLFLLLWTASKKLVAAVIINFIAFLVSDCFEVAMQYSVICSIKSCESGKTWAVQVYASRTAMF